MEGCDELGAFQVLEIRSSLPDELLMYADKLSMAHGLEVRVPYLDKEMVEFAERLPARFKIRRGRRKWLHRRVCEAFLPRTILARKKRGFAVNVVDEWFHKSLDSRIGRYLLDERFVDVPISRTAGRRRLLDEHRSGRNDNHKMLFSLVVFEEWLRASDSAGRNASAADTAHDARYALAEADGTTARPPCHSTTFSSRPRATRRPSSRRRCSR